MATKNRQIYLYDTTLRDGSQREGISFSVADKLKIAKKLDELGVHYIEGGWPGANPKDVEFFEKAKTLKLKKAQLVAFGSTRRAGVKPQEDKVLKGLLEAETPVITIFGKTWDFHVKEALKVSYAENLAMIQDSIAYLKSKGKKVFFDAEHFFDGYKANADYAIETLEAAVKGGADYLVLCDTNGGSLPSEVAQITAKVKYLFKKTPVGIHAHNDSELAVANSLAAIAEGADQVQGTVNGLGERCGNANLSSIIPNLQLKMGYSCISDTELKKLSDISRYVSEIANLSPNDHQPYVGRSAFAHKGGVHVSAIQKNAATYEHIRPELVGNFQRILISEQSGVSNILSKAEDLGISLDKNAPATKEILNRVKELEHRGYQFEGAEGSFELLVRKALGQRPTFFDLEGFRVNTERMGNDDKILTEATIKLRVDKKPVHVAAEGDGPVNALDNALRKALRGSYPQLDKFHLTDFKVRILDSQEGTAARVRVLIESSDGKTSWGTVGVSENIIEAAWEAIVDAVEYGMMLHSK